MAAGSGALISTFVVMRPKRLMTVLTTALIGSSPATTVLLLLTPKTLTLVALSGGSWVDDPCNRAQ